MPLTEQDILDAYSQRRPAEPGIAQTIFDTFFPAPVEGNMPMPFLMPGTLGASPAPPRLGMLSRYKALRESPLWETMPREQQLQALRGQQPTRLSDLSNALTKSSSKYGEHTRGPGWHGWISPLIKGGRKP